MRAAFAFLALALASCGEAPRKEPVDYDAMNRAAEGPAWPISPQPIATGALAELGVTGATCLVPSENHRENLFAASRRKGVLRLDFETLEFAPKPSATPIAFGVSDQYDGLAYTVELTVDRTSETQAGPDGLFYNGEMIVRDARERAVFEHRGRIECISGD